MLTRQPLSVRNNNPGNLERTSVAWLGEITNPADMTAEQRAEQRYCVFRSALLGFRALGLDLYNSWARGRTTVPALISRFAPAGDDNPVANYVNSVCDGMGAGADMALNLTDPTQLASLCRAIATFEAGGWFFEPDDLLAGVALAIGNQVPFRAAG